MKEIQVRVKQRPKVQEGNVGRVFGKGYNVSGPSTLRARLNKLKKFSSEN